MRPKIVLFGDSITEESFREGGWGAALANHFTRTADVVLRGYSGYNTRWALRAIERVLGAEGVGGGGGGEGVVAVTVFFGANDAAVHDRVSAFQHVPVDEYKLNLRSIVSFVKKRWPEVVIILITPPPIDVEGRLREPYNKTSGLPDRTNEAAGAYAKACISVAGECGLPVIDLWSRIQQLDDWEKSCLRDGLHFTCIGNDVLFKEVVDTLGKESVSLETLPVDLPLSSEMYPNDPLKAFESQI
ncbi:hypothetical protein Scep_011551 [Stephania cephalantha]|uniref:SGNH hydrolase-type esterase domain-containing protein n=1 Tax=Stephania cephalantha TaxID=152367 RepID=A0AAP0P5Y8_9MAGN